jgi:hypothetical protein
MIRFSSIISVFQGIGCSVVEFSPATREARVRFPANAGSFEHVISTSVQTPEGEICARLPGQQKSQLTLEKSDFAFIFSLDIYSFSEDFGESIVDVQCVR